MSSPAVRELARDAVRKSLVLLKNDGGALPLTRGQDPGRRQGRGQPADAVGRLVADLAGRQYDDVGLSQRRHVARGDAQDRSARAMSITAPTARASMSAATAPSSWSRPKSPMPKPRATSSFPASMRHTSRYPEDLPALERVSGKGVPVVTSLFSGRPVPANDLINRSDAFVAAWLPGTEGIGLADMLLAGSQRPAGLRLHRPAVVRLAGRRLPAPARRNPVPPRLRPVAHPARSRVGPLPKSPPDMACPPESR